MLRGKEGIYMLESTRARAIAIVQSFFPGMQLLLLSLVASQGFQENLHTSGSVKALANVLVQADTASVSMPNHFVTDKACMSNHRVMMLMLHRHNEIAWC